MAADPQGRLLDGRNRLAACDLAGVEPEFVTADGDPLSLVVSLNVKRRNLTAGQRAIAAAEAWALAPKNLGGGKGAAEAWDLHQFSGAGRKGKADPLASLFDTNPTYVSQARALVEHNPDLAAEVKAGARSLADAYEQHKRRADETKRAAQSDGRAAGHRGSRSMGTSSQKIGRWEGHGGDTRPTLRHQPRLRVAGARARAGGVVSDF